MRSFCQSYYPMQKEIQSKCILGSASNSWKIGHYKLIDFYVWPLFFKCIFYPKTVISIVRFDSDKNVMCGMWAQYKWQTHGKTIKQI